jgi:hypothetical protein
MAVRCRVIADDERDAVDQIEVAVVPRVGEFIEGADGMHCRVTRVLHLRGSLRYGST